MVWVQYLILGLGLAGAYGLTAQGLVVIHRGSGVINFANSGLGLVGAYVEYELHNGGVPAALAVLVGLLAAAILGWVAHYGVMRRLWTAAQLTRVIATLGMLDLIDGLANLRIQQNQLLPPYLLSNHGINIGGEVVSSYNFWLFGIAVATHDHPAPCLQAHQVRPVDDRDLGKPALRVGAGTFSGPHRGNQLGAWLGPRGGGRHPDRADTDDIG